MLRLLTVLFGLMATQALGVQLNVRSASSVPLITAAAYADGDQIGVIQTLTDVLPATAAAIDLKTFLVVDYAKVNHDLQVLFFSSAVGVAADNAAVSVTDADMAASYLGSISIAEADYATLAANTAVAKLPGLLLKGGAGTKNLYYLVVCRDSGGCDYGAIGDLTFKFTFYE